MLKELEKGHHNLFFLFPGAVSFVEPYSTQHHTIQLPQKKKIYVVVKELPEHVKRTRIPKDLKKQGKQQKTSDSILGFQYHLQYPKEGPGSISVFLLSALRLDLIIVQRMFV